MMGIFLIAGATAGALWLWKRTENSQPKQIQLYYNGQPYYGAPAWPTMNPVPVPEAGLPYGTQQAATYYGVDSTLLEPFLK